MTDLFVYELTQLNSPRVREEFSDVFKSLTEFRFTSADTPEISSRVLSHWAKEGILLEDFREQKWRRFDLVSFLWLQVVQQLREFNVPLKVIRNLANSFKVEDDFNKMFSSKELEHVIKGLSKKSDTKIKDVKELLARPEVRESIKQALPSYFMILVLDAVLMRDHLSILVNRDGDFLPFKESFRNDYNKIPGGKAFLNGSYVSVSISDLLRKYFESQDPFFLANELRLITHDEASVLNALKEPGLESIEIRYANGEMDRIQIKRKMEINPSQRLYEIMTQEGYQDIEIKVQNKTIVCCHNTYKAKLKDLGTG